MHLGVTVALGALTAALVIAQAWLLAAVIARSFDDGVDVGDVRSPLAALLAVVLLRAAVAWYSEVSANRASSNVKSALRVALVEKLAADAPAARNDPDGHLATLATHGVDALDGYFSRYLPQLVLAVIVPVAVIAAVCTADWISALIIAVTIPLIPIFMALIGMRVQRRQDRQLRTLQVLSGHFLDVVRGLTTLKVFGRSKAQVETIRAVTESYRRTTMSTLKLAFLSSLVLELLASVAVALVAVSVGLRLLYGHLDLQTALFALVLAPEAYLPLRSVGTSYHASAEGLSAADQVFEVLERPAPARATAPTCPTLHAQSIVLDDIAVALPGSRRGRPRPFLAHDRGRSGRRDRRAERLREVDASRACCSGSSSPTDGSVSIGGVPLSSLDPTAWRRAPRLGATAPAPVRRVDRRQPATRLCRSHRRRAVGRPRGRIPRAPESPRSRATSRHELGERGAGLSVGEAQRLAIARALLRRAPLLLLDEPTAHLDATTEARVIASLAQAVQGRTVILVTHRPAALALADRVVSLEAIAASR